MSSALAIAGVHPVIDKVNRFLFVSVISLTAQTFKFEEMQDAYRYMQEGRHFGKVCVEV
jgi:NADPH:quinone reductase-like Zn-dependent oxidoreductase